MTVYGVDVHARYQAGISFAKLKQEKYSFVVMKLTEGRSLSYLDSAKKWVPAIRAAGLIPGCYHWIGAGDGTKQAKYFYDQVAHLGGPTGLLIALDTEDDATLDNIRAWATEWRRLSGNHPFLLYTGGWWWRPRGWNGAQITPYLWDSHYLSADADIVSDDVKRFAARIPTPWWTPGYGKWPQATIIQFTSKGDAGTLGNKVDLNVFRGTLNELRALTGIGDEDVPLTKKDVEIIAKTDNVFRAPSDAGDLATNTHWTLENHIESQTRHGRLTYAAATRIEAALAQALGRDPISEQAIIDGVLAGLGTRPVDDVAAALRAAMSPEQITALAAKLASAE